MKMIVRADDVGFTDVCNIGAFLTFDKGVSTAADVMLDSPGTEDALRRLRAYPWVSVGWHAHMWGAPVLGPEKTPTLVEKSGPFAGRFRTDLFSAADIDPAEAEAEALAQLTRCRDILGRFPDTGAGGRKGVMGGAMERVQEKLGIPLRFMKRCGGDPRTAERIMAGRGRGEEWAFLYKPQGMPPAEADEKWAARSIVSADGGLAYIDLMTDSFSDVELKYDPVLYYTEDRAGLLALPAGTVAEQSWHPGYVDYYVYRLGERMNRPRARQFTVARCQDAAALCDPRLFEWIRENRVELVNFRDALYGTGEYQAHLRAIGSELYMG